MASRRQPIDIAQTSTMQLPLTRPIGFRLDWEPDSGGKTGADLDIGCLYWTDDGRRGAIQSVHPVSGDDADRRQARLVADGVSIIELLSDDETGRSLDGENLILERPDLISFMVVFVSIYDGTSDFRRVGANVTVRRANRAVARAGLASPDPGLNWCAVLLMGRRDNKLLLVHEERYFLSAYHADQHYGFKLSWGLGTKS